jgi:hypothetical protein
MNYNEKIRLGLSNILIIVFVFLGFSLVSLGISYSLSDSKYESNIDESDSCTKSFSDLGAWSINKNCDEFNFYISDTNNNLNFSGILTRYNSSDHYTLKLNFNGNSVAPDFFINKEKLAVFGYSTQFFYHDKYVIVKTNSGAEYNDDYVAVIDSTDGNVVFVFEAGEMLLEDDTLTMVKHNSNIFCDDTNGSEVSGKTYTYKLSSEGVVLEKEVNNTCAE